MTSQSTLGPPGLVTGCSRGAPSAWPQAHRPQSRELPLPYHLVFTGTCSKQVRKSVVLFIEKVLSFFYISLKMHFTQSYICGSYSNISHMISLIIYWCYLTLCKAFHKILWYSRLEIEAKLPFSVRPTWFTWSPGPAPLCSLHQPLASKCLLFWWNLFKPESKAGEVQN